MLTTRIGDLTVHVLSDGQFRLDGGAMFGVVPKVLWHAKLPSDDANRVTLGLNCMLVTTPDGVHVLADTGMGDRWSEKDRATYGIDRRTTLTSSLAEVGLEPSAIDVVINSHLHFDHAGGNTRLDGQGSLVPTFPSARHVVQRREWQEAQHPHERHRASYRPDDFLPLEAAGLLDLVEGTAEVAPGVFVDHVPGHCPGMQVVRLESRGEGLVFPADLMPTAAHLRPAWNMGYDLDVVRTVDAKRDLIERVLERDWTLCFDHDPRTPLVKLRREQRDGRETVVTVPVGEAVAA